MATPAALASHACADYLDHWPPYSRRTGYDGLLSDSESSPVFDQIGGELVVSHGAYAFRPEDGDFVDAFNAELTAFIGTPDHIAIMEKHGMTPDELPIQKTDELCAG